MTGTKTFSKEDVKLAYEAGMSRRSAHFTDEEVERLQDMGFTVNKVINGFGCYQTVQIKEEE